MAETVVKKYKFEVDSAPVKTLRKELRETLETLQGMEVGSEAFDQMTLKAAQLKDKMADINEQVNVFASGSKYEQAGNSIGEIGSALNNLDFEKATDRASAFGKVAKNISFKDAIGSVKQLGSTFVTLGKTILTNPLFLIVAVVGAIVAVIVGLLDKLGILEKIFKVVGDAIDFVIQKMKDFLDWLGLTSYAAEDAAEKQAVAQEKIAKSHEDKREKVVDAYDHEIRLAKIAGQNTVEMERQKQYAIIETSKQQLDALTVQIQSLRAAGTLTKEKADEIRKAMAELRTGIREARQEVGAINAQEVADNKKLAEDNAKTAQENTKAQKAQRKQNKADRLAALRAIQDAENSIMEEGIDKDLTILRTKATREREDILASTKLTTDEKNKMEKLMQEQFQIDVQNIKDKYQKIEDDKNKEASDKLQAKIDADLDAWKKADTEKLEIEAQNREKKKEQDKIAAENALDLAQNVTAAILANAKEGSKFAKAVAIGQTTIDTYRGATAAFASTAASPLGIANPVAPYIAAAAAVAMGLANVRRIVATDNQGMTSGMGGAPAVQQPNFGQATTPQTTPQMFINNNGTNAGGDNYKQKVMVVDYYDIQQKGNELLGLKQKTTLA